MDASIGPYVLRLERQDIGIGGFIEGGLQSAMLVPYPDSTEKSMYATIEPFNYQVNAFGLIFSIVGLCDLIIYLS